MNSGGAGVSAHRSMQLTGRVMGFLIKSAFWFSLVLLALPINTGKNGEQTVGAIQAFLAAREAVSDLSGICERKPDVCETGKSAMTTVGLRAREAARIAYELLDEHLEEPAATDQEVGSDKMPKLDSDAVTGSIEEIIRNAEPKN
jgi:hypothetical protein